ncbi:MAG: sucrase ferredoxin [Acidimicrobiales bacterium]
MSIDEVRIGRSETGPRCADWAREVGVDPVGTAVHARGWLLLDWPLPWPRDVAEIAALEPVRAAIAGTGIRVQLMVPPPDADRWSVVVHELGPGDDGWFSGYRRRAVSVEPAHLIATALDLVTGANDANDANDANEADPLVDPAVTDVLLCGHGSRDRCCGSMGTALAVAAQAEGLAVRRTSHTGGHRFAPTGLLLPQGTAWAFLDDDALTRIISASGPVDDLLDRYRGSVALASPQRQAAERAVFGVVGWPWLQHRRRAVPLDGVGTDEGRVLVEAIDPAGRHRSWTVEVAAGRRLPVPECGRDPATAPKSETEVAVTSLVETTAS